MPAGGAWPADSKRALVQHERIPKRAAIDRRNAQGEVVDLHALRHTAATRYATSGVPITFVQKLLGHSTIELTARYYTHLDVEDVRRALERASASG
jgi:integrase